MQNLKQFFLIKDDITFLNFGSFGACTRPVFETWQKFQLEMEQDPVQFIVSDGLKYLTIAREALAGYINCDPDNLVYVTNPSYAVNAITKSFKLQPGDEILATDIEYGACDKTWEYYCEKAGATYRRQHISLPVTSKEEIVAEFFKGLTPKTKMVFISHITSTTGLRLPVEEICAVAREKGLRTFVDGAHAPGQIPLDLNNAPFDYYTGACHKWMMTPKGSAFLYVKKEYQSAIDPLIISWGYKSLFPSNSQFLDYHQTNGTRDYTSFLTIPAALEFMKVHDWSQVAANCRELVHANAKAYCDILDTVPLSPVTDAFMLQLCSAEIKTREPEKLKLHLYDDYKIQIPVMRQDDKVYLRYSINAFNNQGDLDTLFNAIRRIKKTTSLIE
ncbi:MAG: aminotransferase class V-fold PLP-dependent enzyme [Chitinophagaceae bacterium]